MGLPKDPKNAKPWLLNPKPRKADSTTRRAKVREERVAKRTGGERHAFSGGRDEAKGDATSGAFDPDRKVVESFLFDDKHTRYTQLTLKVGQLSKLCNEALAQGKEPALSFGMDTSKFPMVPKDWVAIPLRVFETLFVAEDEDDE